MGFFYSGEGERTVLNQAKGLMKKGHQVKVYAPIIAKDCFPELAKEVELVKISKNVPESAPLKTALKMIDSSLQPPTKEFRDDEVIIAHGQPSNWIAYRVSKKTGTPYVSYLHQANRFLHPREVDRKTGWKIDPSLAFLNLLHKGNSVIKKLDNISIKSSTIILTNSNWIRLQIQQAYQKNSVICYPGVDIQKFKPTEKPTNDYILTTNRHIPQKRIDYLLTCIKKIKAKYPEIQCKITGESTPHTRELKELRSKLQIEKNVTFTGKLSAEQLISAYQNAYTYAYTSPEEDFGLGPLEAAACKIPSIVWDHAGPRETVINEKTGFRVKPYDLDKMTEKHILLLEDPPLREKMGKNAFKHVKSKFTWKHHCDRLEKVLESALKHH
jgi:glycosyltransferase involved in cell wall biosynthesis